MEKLCTNCGRPQSEHQDTVYGNNTRCKIEGIKIYFNDPHWTGQTVDELAEERGLTESCEHMMYECWNCHNDKVEAVKREELKQRILGIFNVCDLSRMDTSDEDKNSLAELVIKEFEK